MILRMMMKRMSRRRRRKAKSWHIEQATLSSHINHGI